MSRVRRIAGQLWSFRWLLLGNLFLLSPTLISDVVGGEVGIDPIALFSVPASILWLLAVNFAFEQPWRAHLLLLPFYLLTGIDLYLLSTYDARLTSSLISVMLENAHHLGEFVQTQPGPVFLVATVPLGVWALVFFKTRPLRFPPSRIPLWVSVGGLMFVYGSLTAYRSYQADGLVNGLRVLVIQDRNSPFGVFPQGYLAWRVYEDARAHQERAASFRFGATRKVTPQEPELYVFVIGESSRPDRWSLYGLDRPTTPNLSAQSNLLVFRDMVSPAPVTQVSVPLMLTRNSIENPEAFSSEKSIVSAFKEAGFETFWLSTQQRDLFTGVINRYSGEADHTRFFERRYDEILVEGLKSFAESQPREKLFFVLHTQGSHFTYSSRYPASAARFTPTGTERERILAEYDNTIAYTDEVLSRLIRYLETRPGISALFYISDHGENLKDDDRQLIGHFYSNEYDLPIPAVLWYSDAFAAAFPEKIAGLKTNLHKPLNTRVVFSTLADLGSLTLPDMEISRLSAMNPRLSPPPRLFKRNDRILDYDAWRATQTEVGCCSAPADDR